MKRIISLLVLCVLLCSVAAAQNKLSITVGGQTWVFNLPTEVVALTCDKTSLARGESSNCTATLNAPAPATTTGQAFTVTYTADPPLTLNPATLTIPAGNTSFSFQVTRPK